MAKPVAPAVKGNVLISRLAFVRERGGEAAVDAVLSRLSRSDQEALRGWILPVGWYPLELNIRLDDAIAGVLSPEDRTRVFLEMGRASADASLNGPQRPYVKEGDPHFLLANSARLYATYHAVGRREYERTGETSAVLRTYEAEGVNATDCLTIVGWYVRGIEISGGVDAKIVETQCRLRGDRCCEYTCTWRKRASAGPG